MNALEVFGSFESAAELDKEPHTGCTLVSAERHIALSPKYIGRLRTGVGEILDAELGRFSESLRGVLLAYGNVKLLQSSGVIVDDSPFIHFDVKFDAVVFNPKIGSLLKCVVIEQASDHVGCLVHDWFNVSLLASRKELSGQKLPKLEPGYVVLVQVERLRSLNRMLAIEARAPDDGSDLILEAMSLQSKDTDSESNVDSVLQSSLSDTPDVAGKSSGTTGNEASGEKKKKKRVKVKLEQADSLQSSVSDTTDVTPMSTVTAGTEASGKKKKKKHAKVELPEVDSLQPSVSDSVDGSGVLTIPFGGEAKSEKKKKRKHENVKQELDVDSLQPSLSDLQDGSGSSRTAGEEARGGKKKKKHSEVKQEWDVDSLQPSLCLKSSTGETQTGVETSKHKKSKKRKQLETTDETSGIRTQNNAAELTTGEQTSPKKKKKKKHSKNEAAEPGPKSLTNHSGHQITQITTGEETSSTKKNKKKNSETRTGVDCYQPSFIPNGPTAIVSEKEVEMKLQESHDEDVVSNLLPLFNEQFTKLKKHKDREIHTAVDSSLKPLSPDSSSTVQTVKKVKKHKKKVQSENADGNGA
ncbi:DNA-directed RNA polymerase I subunit RPA43-like [Patiria miniata]|uniref:DNA-directed RNA polymerase I subunit RPA43 n=1 Tax=Patiria miniata TaxID=46514 RepID=A0A914A9F8_PATMI|nr:DNA-directed RNA polymerase I subunit RPA43-like [Patiria miniata]